MLEITTQFFPYRLKLQNREPVELKVSIKNNSNEPTSASFDINTDKTLSLDKGGYKTAENVILGVLAPGAIVNKRFDVFAKHMAKKGEHKIYIRAMEHYNNNYNLIKSEYKKTTEIIVE
ncbi:MAG: hypothetical protein QXZ13_03735 [Candidatus Diapherotrites archaeon]